MNLHEQTTNSIARNGTYEPDRDVRDAHHDSASQGNVQRVVDADPVGSRVVTVAVINDYEVVVRGVASMLAPYSHRVRVVELDVGGDGNVPADVALFDTFAGRRHTLARAAEMVREGSAKHI